MRALETTSLIFGCRRGVSFHEPPEGLEVKLVPAFGDR